MRGLQTLTDSLQAIAPVLQGRVAQSVEQRIENPRVASSILAPATSFYSPNCQILLSSLTNSAVFAHNCYH